MTLAKWWRDEMQNRRNLSLAFTVPLFALALLPLPAHAAFPAKIFSPYLEIDSGANLTSKLTTLKSTTGLPYYTLAFMNENTADTNVIWGSGGSVSATGTNPAYISQINALRAVGGDVILSFGGADSNEPADVSGMTLTTLESQYQAVINAYHATWLDFDIEGDPLNNTAANQMRNTALKALQVANPGLQISYTLAADPNGLDSNGFKLLQDAASKGLNIRTVNAMTMDFGTWTVKGVVQTESQLSISTATAVHNEIESTLPNTGIGMTVLIGQSDNPGEVFQLTDAQPVLNFAETTSYINFLSMWSIDRDNASTKTSSTDNATNSGIVQSQYFFTNTFQALNTPEPATLSLLAVTPALLLTRSRRKM
jgi:chitinase